MKKIWIILIITLLLVGCSQSTDEGNTILARGPVSTVEAYEMFLEEYEDWSVRTMLYITKDEKYQIYGYADDLEVVIDVFKDGGKLERIEVRDLMDMNESSDVMLHVIELIDQVVENVLNIHSQSHLIKWQVSELDEIFILDVHLSSDDSDEMSYKYDLLKQELITIDQ